MRTGEQINNMHFELYAIVFAIFPFAKNDNDPHDGQMLCKISQSGFDTLCFVHVTFYVFTLYTIKQ